MLATALDTAIEWTEHLSVDRAECSRHATAITAEQWEASVAFATTAAAMGDGDAAIGAMLALEVAIEHQPIQDIADAVLLGRVSLAMLERQMDADDAALRSLRKALEFLRQA